ncbi:MAG: hypothetical protein INH43_00220 [Acidobacteriaceae bacterium]|nr:hypothetical protein [Acidobacteriaceae bacterium]
MRIRLVEERIGGRLFEQLARGVRLTSVAHRAGAGAGGGGGESASTGPYGPGAPPLGRGDAEESAGSERFLSGSSASRPAPAGRLLSPPNRPGDIGSTPRPPRHGGGG